MIARNSGGAPPGAKFRENRTLPVLLVEGEAGLPGELWDGSLSALPLGQTLMATSTKAHPRPVPGANSEKPPALSHISGA